MSKACRYVACISHCTPSGDDILLARAERAGPLRALRTDMKELGRSSGLSFYLSVFPDRHPDAPRRKPTDHDFRCMAGRGRA